MTELAKAIEAYLSDLQDGLIDPDDTRDDILRADHFENIAMEAIIEYTTPIDLNELSEHASDGEAS